MPKRNHSRRTRLQQQLDPLLEAFVDSWMGRSWLLVGPDLPRTTNLIKESFDNDLERIVHFLTAVTDGRIVLGSLFFEEASVLKMRDYWRLSDIRDDIATLIQFPALVGSVDEAVAWAQVFLPRLREQGDGVYSPEYDLRASLIEIRKLREAGVPIEYVRAFDTDGRSRYPVDIVLEAHRDGLAAEFALAALGR